MERRSRAVPTAWANLASSSRNPSRPTGGGPDAVPSFTWTRSFGRSGTIVSVPRPRLLRNKAARSTTRTDAAARPSAGRTLRRAGSGVRRRRPRVLARERNLRHGEVEESTERLPAVAGRDVHDEQAVGRNPATDGVVVLEVALFVEELMRGRRPVHIPPQARTEPVRLR